MSPEVLLPMFLIPFIISEVSGSYVGICIDTSISSIKSALDTVDILKSMEISHVRLLYADHKMLTALANTGIEVMVGITNEELPQIGRSKEAAALWIQGNVEAYVPATNITAIAVGNEVLTKMPNNSHLLVDAMHSLHSVLAASNLSFLVKISSPQSIDVIQSSFPPSTSSFNSSLTDIMRGILQFLKDTGSIFMLNAFPYYGYLKAKGIFTLDYALSNHSLSPSGLLVDPNSNLIYSNMLTAFVDAVYVSMETLDISGVPVVTETGWPWCGGPNETDASVHNAMVYNKNLISFVLNNSGTPYKPSMPLDVYIYELFNENQTKCTSDDNHWGILSANGTPVYHLPGFSNTSGNSSMVQKFCVARPGARDEDLSDGLNWACGDGKANCMAIQRGQPCYKPDTLMNHASYAYNDYYQRHRSASGSCNFSGTAMYISTDPSYNSCIFAGSTRNHSISPSSVPVPGQNGGVSRERISIPQFLIAAAILVLV